MTTWETRPVTPDRFDDFADVVNRRRGPNRCWCLSHRGAVSGGLPRLVMRRDLQGRSGSRSAAGRDGLLVAPWHP